MIVKKELKSVGFLYDTDKQTLTIREYGSTPQEARIITGEVTVNKTYMFSIGIFIDQIKRSQFVHKKLKIKIKSLESKVELLETRVKRAEERIAKLKSADKHVKML